MYGVWVLKSILFAAAHICYLGNKRKIKSPGFAVYQEQVDINKNLWQVEPFQYMDVNGVFSCVPGVHL